MRTHIEGLIAAPFTPMHADGQLNLDAIGPMASLLGRQGVAGVFVGGSTGESLSLTLQERLDLTRTWISSAPRGQKVLIHVGAGSIEDSKAIAAHAQQHGATAIASMAPVFFKPRNHEELVAYCGAVASAAPELPFYYYHIPFRTGVCLPVAGFLRAASTRVPKLAGVKFTHEDLMDYQECLALEDGRFDMLFGRDEMLLAGLALGARGAVGTTYNFAAPLYTRIIAAFQHGDIEEARRLQLRAVHMIQLLADMDAPVLSAAKAVMGMIGVECGPPRLPLPSLREDQKNALRTGLEQLGFFEDICG